MNPLRFLKKCLTDPPAALLSAKQIIRAQRGVRYWKKNPDKPLRYQLPGGGVLLLDRAHSFTRCFYPAVEGYEPEVREVLKHLLRPGQTFVDCGSNIGYFSVLAGSIVGKAGRVVAVEANPVTFKLLERNLQTNGFGAAVHGALSTQPGHLELFVPNGDDDVFSSTRQGGLVSGEGVRSYKVPARRLDDVVAEQGLARVDVIKIDVEGAELDVLRSGVNTLAKHRPYVVMEYGTNTWPSFGATVEELQKIAAEARYAIREFDPATRSVTPVAPSFWQAPYANLLLVPIERDGGDSGGAR